ncbi:MAG: hypothetical protein NC114_10755 [Ruminococcus flavefaciens]|nr:hypothetical protein [Ruminococcus flavefaciens]
MPAYEFATDNLSECSAEFQFMLANEASNLREIMAGTDEILAEAAFTNPGSVDALNENVFTTLKDGVVKFFNKIIAMVKGLIEKIKAFIYKMTGKTDKWLKIMEPKINAAKNNKGYGDVSAEMYNWNAAFITGTSGDCMAGGLDKLVADWRAECDVVGKSSAKNFVSNARQDTKDAKAAAGMDADGKPAGKATGTFDKATKTWVDSLEKFKSSAPDKIGAAWKIKATSMDVLTSELRKKATGGAEKTERKFGNDTGAMIDAIKNSTKTMEKVKKAYEDHLKHLTDFKANLEKQGDELGDLGKKGDTIPTEVVRAATDHVKAMYNYAMEVTRTYENAMNAVKNLNTSLIQEMCTEYMSALTKFANFKGTK